MKNFFLILIAALVLFIGCTKEGLDGKNTLMNFSIEPNGDNCLSGGYKIVSGIDLNSNNILDEGEIQNIEFICNGDDGKNGNNSLINVVSEPIGVNCSSGGHKIISGIDINDNDILDENEIQNTEFICNGDDGKNGNNSLINVVSEPIGVNCSSGGYKIISGIDINDNDILDENEIQNTEFICNGDDGITDKQIRLKMYSNLYNRDGDTTIVSSFGVYYGLVQFNKENYPELDSIVFVVYDVSTKQDCCSGIDIVADVEIGLYDLTNDALISNSTIITDDIERNTYVVSKNLIENLPSGYIDLGVRIVVNGDYHASMGNVYLFLYRE